MRILVNEKSYNAPKLMIFVSFGAVSTLKTRQIDEKSIDLARYNLPFSVRNLGRRLVAT